MLTTLPPNGNSILAGVGPSRQLYMQLREAPVRTDASIYLERRLAEAALLPPAWSDGMEGLEAWLDTRARTRWAGLRQYHEARQEGAPRRHFATLAQARRFLSVQAPLLLAEGAWLYHTTDHWRQPHFAPLINLYLGYLGKGVPAHNCVGRLRQTLAAQGCGQAGDLEDGHYVQGAIRLALSCAGELFLPEVLGYQLGAAEQATAHPAVLQELAELGIGLQQPPAADDAVLLTLRALLRSNSDSASMLQRVERGYALNRLGMPALPATPESGAPQDAPVAATAAVLTTPPAQPAPPPVESEGPRPVLRHAFPADEHAWETISSDLGLLEAQIANCSSKGEAMAVLVRHMGPASHHQPLGLMATRIYAQLFALG